MPNFSTRATRAADHLESLVTRPFHLRPLFRFPMSAPTMEEPLHLSRHSETDAALKWYRIDKIIYESVAPKAG
jgi:hypothetical protein